MEKAEVIADAAQNEVPDETTIPEHTRKKRKSRPETYQSMKGFLSQMRSLAT